LIIFSNLCVIIVFVSPQTGVFADKHLFLENVLAPLKDRIKRLFIELTPWFSVLEQIS